MPTTTVRIVLELDPGADPIAGVARREPGAERRFAGWLELSAALERLRSEPAAAAPARPLAAGPS